MGVQRTTVIINDTPYRTYERQNTSPRCITVKERAFGDVAEVLEKWSAWIKDGVFYQPNYDTRCRELHDELLECADRVQSYMARNAISTSAELAERQNK